MSVITLIFGAGVLSVSVLLGLVYGVGYAVPPAFAPVYWAIPTIVVLALSGAALFFPFGGSGVRTPMPSVLSWLPLLLSICLNLYLSYPMMGALGLIAGLIIILSGGVALFGTSRLPDLLLGLSLRADPGSWNSG